MQGIKNFVSMKLKTKNNGKNCRNKVFFFRFCGLGDCPGCPCGVTPGSCSETVRAAPGDVWGPFVLWI